MTLSDLMESKGVTIAALARRARLSEGTIENARAGKNTSASTQYLISIVLGVDEDEVREAIDASKAQQ